MDESVFGKLPAKQGEWQIVGALGVVIAAPSEWNPVVVRGEAQGLWGRVTGDLSGRGVVVLADLRGPRMEVRWWTAGRHATERTTRLVAKLRRGQAQVREAEDGVWRVNEPAAPRVQYLGPMGARVYELTLVRGEEDLEHEAARWFWAANLRMLEAGSSGYWNMYGACGWVDERARVRRMNLLPGKTEIILGVPGGRVTLGAIGLADQVARGGILEWAKRQRWGTGSAGTWMVDEAGAVRWEGTECRRFCKRVRHAIEVRDQPAANRIAWTHWERWGRSKALGALPA